MIFVSTDGRCGSERNNVSLRIADFASAGALSNGSETKCSSAVGTGRGKDPEIVGSHFPAFAAADRMLQSRVRNPSSSHCLVGSFVSSFAINRLRSLRQSDPEREEKERYPVCRWLWRAHVASSARFEEREVTRQMESERRAEDSRSRSERCSPWGGCGFICFE